MSNSKQPSKAERLKAFKEKNASVKRKPKALVKSQLKKDKSLKLK
jgi:hypothetical protein